MKKIVLSLVVMACFALPAVHTAAQAAPRTQVETTTDSTYTKLEVKDLPKAVQDGAAKAYEGATVKEAAVTGKEGSKKYKLTLVTSTQEEKTAYFNEKGEEVKEEAK